MNKLLNLSIFALSLAGCAGSSQWGKGVYRDVVTEIAQPYHMQDKLDEFDEERLLTAVVDQIQKCQNLPPKSILLVQTVENMASIPIDSTRLTAELNSRLTGRGFVIIEKEGRRDIATEMDYQSLGYTRQDQAAVKGRQDAVNFIVKPRFSEKSQNDGDKKAVFYRFDVAVIDIERSISLPNCMPSSTLGKTYERTRVSF